MKQILFILFFSATFCGYGQKLNKKQIKWYLDDISYRVEEQEWERAFDLLITLERSASIEKLDKHSNYSFLKIRQKILLKKELMNQNKNLIQKLILAYQQKQYFNALELYENIDKKSCYQDDILKLNKYDSNFPYIKDRNKQLNEDFKRWVNAYKNKNYESCYDIYFFKNDEIGYLNTDQQKQVNIIKTAITPFKNKYNSLWQNTIEKSQKALDKINNNNLTHTEHQQVVCELKSILTQAKEYYKVINYETPKFNSAWINQKKKIHNAINSPKQNINNQAIKKNKITEAKVICKNLSPVYNKIFNSYHEILSKNLQYRTVDSRLLPIKIIIEAVDASVLVNIVVNYDPVKLHNSTYHPYSNKFLLHEGYNLKCIDQLAIAVSDWLRYLAIKNFNVNIDLEKFSYGIQLVQNDLKMQFTYGIYFSNSGYMNIYYHRELIMADSKSRYVLQANQLEVLNDYKFFTIQTNGYSTEHEHKIKLFKKFFAFK